MHRFFAESEKEDGSLCFLSPEDARHARTVLRLSEGDTVELLLPDGRFLAEIRRMDGNQVCVEKRQPLPDPEPRLNVTLFQGLPKADKMDWIVQKASELGIRRIVPLRMARSVVRLDPGDAGRKRERWQKIAREACKQSGRCRIPEITLPLSPAEVLSLIREMTVTVVPWEETETGGPLSVRKAFPDPASLGIIIGPEGGIEPSEIALFRQSGALPITLGRRILRTETAGLAALSAFMTLYGEMEE